MKIKSELSKILILNRSLLKPLLIIFLIYLLAFSAILLAGVHFADDVARTNFGYPGWAAFSRYIDTSTSIFLHADRYLTNIAPLPQIIAIFFLALSTLILIIVISGKSIFKDKFSTWILHILVATPLVLCPYFLECISYQYDAPYMALSILFVVSPLLFREKSKSLYLFTITIGILGASMTYQASIGIFIVLVIFLAIKKWSEKEKFKKILNFLLLSAGSFLLTLIIFQKVLMRRRDVYVSNSLPPINKLFPEFTTHLIEYYRFIFSDFKPLWLILIGFIVLSFIILFTIKSKHNKIFALFISITGLALMLMMVYAPYAILSKPPYTTRSMYPIGSIIAIIGLYLMSNYNWKNNWRKITLIPSLALAWCFFIFAFTYGNALKEQNTYHDFQVNAVLYDLNELLPTLGEKNKIVQVSGQIDYAPIINHMPDNTRNILHRILKASYGRNVPWMAYRLTQGYWLDSLSFNSEINLTEKNLPTIKDTALYTIKGNSESILVEFKGEMFEV